MKRALQIIVLIVGSLAAAMAPMSEAQAALLPTHVKPAGDYVQMWSTKFMIGNWECANSTSQPATPLGKSDRNQIPTTGNPSISGPVTIPMRPPSVPVSSCTVWSAAGNMFPSSVTTRGLWRVTLQHKSRGDIGKLTIPKAGIVMRQDVYIGGNWTQCTRTVGADGPVRLSGSWTDGNPSKLAIWGENIIPVTPGGPAFPCGTGTVMMGANLTYAFSNLSHPAINITVS